MSPKPVKTHVKAIYRKLGVRPREDAVANALYPQWLRDLLLTLAAFGYYEPRW